MKKIVLFSYLMVSALSAILVSCQQEVTDPNGTNNNNPAVTGDFRAKIEGTQWVANKATAAYRLQGLISITGVSNDKKTVTITLVDSGVHRYTLSDVTPNAAAYQDSTLPSVIAFTSNGGAYPAQAGGEVNITAIDAVNKKISGTFSFKAYRQSDGLQRTITEGSFTNLSYSTSLPPSNSTDTFTVKIAGTQWVPPTVFAVKSPAIPPLPASIAISGTNGTISKTVGLQMPADITPGSYTLDFFGLTYIGTYLPNANPNNSQASVSGTLTILSHNTTTKRIRGNFNFVSQELLNPTASTQLTEGYFSVTYQ